MKKTSWQSWLDAQQSMLDARPHSVALLPPPQGSGRPCVQMGNRPDAMAVKEARTYGTPDGDFTVLTDYRSMQDPPVFITPEDWDVKSRWAPDEEEWDALKQGS